VKGIRLAAKTFFVLIGLAVLIYQGLELIAIMFDLEAMGSEGN
jgi:hypothetical protein